MSTSDGLPQLWTRCIRGVVTVFGEVDLATHMTFASAVNAVVAAADATDPRCEVHLDLGGLDFIDVGGAQILVAAARERAGFGLVVHRPPPMLVRIVDLGWGKVPGLRLVEHVPGAHVPAMTA